MKQRLAILLAMLILAVSFVGCGTRSAVESSAPIEVDTSEKTQLELGYALWPSSIANSHMVKAVLEEKFDVLVNLNAMDKYSMWGELATNNIDFIVSAWMPCNNNYYSMLSDKIVNLGPVYEEAKFGLIVPTYVDIDSIDEINAHADQFDGKIIGVDPGTCGMIKTIKAIHEYDMTDITLDPSTFEDMPTELKSAYDNQEWIVVAGWTPHWMFDTMDLKFLEDPKHIFAEQQSINVFTRLNFAKEYPEINKFLDNYSLDTEQMRSLMNIMEEYDDDNEAAKVWIEENRELVDSWFE